MQRKIINHFIYNYISNGMPNPSIPAYLSPSYSQNYEDVVLDCLLKAYLRNVKKDRYIISFVEIGANHPVCTSSSFFFREKYGLTGVLVEANPALIPALQKYRNGDMIINSAVCVDDSETIDFHISNDNEVSSLDKKFVDAWEGNGFKETIKVKSTRINALMEKVKSADEVLLFIDVEGMDLQIIQDLDFSKYRPLSITIEPSDAFLNGNSEKIIDFLNSKKYNLAAETNHNLIFLRNS